MQCERHRSCTEQPGRARGDFLAETSSGSKIQVNGLALLPGVEEKKLRAEHGFSSRSRV